MPNLKPFASLEKASKQEIRKFIADVEVECLRHGVQVEIPISHHFSRKVYAREMKLKAGDFIVGKIHRYENLNILSEGEVAVCSIDGILRVKAPHTFVGSAGTKRVIYALSDVTWTTIHGTEKTSITEIEKEVIAESYHDFENFPGNRDIKKELK